MKESKILIFSLGILSLVGAPAVYSVVKMPEEVSSSARVPASATAEAVFESSSEPRNAAKAKSVTMDFNCRKNTEVAETEGSHVRLRSQNCVDANEKQITIVNKANGYTASVIITRNSQFTTDFIELSEGDNQIEIQSEEKNGEKVVQYLNLKRRAPASFVETQ